MMMEKAQEKQPDNLTTKLTETLNSSLTKMIASIFEITKGSGKRTQKDKVGQGSPKIARTYLRCQKENETCSRYVNIFLFGSESSATEDTSVTRTDAGSEKNQRIPILIL